MIDHERHISDCLDEMVAANGGPFRAYLGEGGVARTTESERIAARDRKRGQRRYHEQVARMRQAEAL